MKDFSFKQIKFKNWEKRDLINNSYNARGLNPLKMIENAVRLRILRF